MNILERHMNSNIQKHKIIMDLLQEKIGRNVLLEGNGVEKNIKNAEEYLKKSDYDKSADKSMLPKKKI